MAERLHPGVYVDEVSGGSRPIEGASTSTAGFVGIATPKGPSNKAYFVTSFEQYEKIFGGHASGEKGYLAAAVEAFFNAGGTRAYVVGVLGRGATAGKSAEQLARRKLEGSAACKVLKFNAKSAGKWSEALQIYITSASENFRDEAFSVEVKLRGTNDVFRLAEKFEDVRMDPNHEAYVMTVVNGLSRLIEVEDLRGGDQPWTGLPQSVPCLRSGQSLTEDTPIQLEENSKLVFTLHEGNTALHTTEVIIETNMKTYGQVKSAIETELKNVCTRKDDGGRWAIEAKEAKDKWAPQLELKAIPIALPQNLIGESIELEWGGDKFEIGFTEGKDSPAKIEAKAGNNPPVSDAFESEVNLKAVKGDQLLKALEGVLKKALNGKATPSSGEDGKSLTIKPTAESIEIKLRLGQASAKLLSFKTASGSKAEADVDKWLLTVREEQGKNVRSVLKQIGLSAVARGYKAGSKQNPELRPAETTAANPITLSGGEDGQTATDNEFKDALAILRTEEVNLLVIPGKFQLEFLGAAMEFCDNQGNCFFIGDTPGGKDDKKDADDSRNWVNALSYVSKNAALYYPWLQVSDPVGVGRNPVRYIPPSGHIAGIFARTDNSRGVWKAPAGVEANVRGVLDVQVPIGDKEQDILNNIGLNCIRRMPGAGIVVWGARTLATRSDPEWRYVPVRRLGLFLKESIRRGMQWAVFEPNDAPLWERIRITINAFMLSLFRQGAFQGARPDEAFYVRCDRSTNPQESVDQGIVTAKVGFAPLKPAEFVVIEISQKSLVS